MPISTFIFLCRLVLSLFLLLLATIGIAVNFHIFYMVKVHKYRSSLVPLVGGLFGFVGCLVSPFALLNYLCWAPLILDIGCVPSIVATILYLISNRSRQGDGSQGNHGPASGA